MKLFGPAIGEKFDEQGNVINIPGNTFITFIDKQTDVYEHVVKISSMLESLEFYKNYIPLPEESYHMTVVEGVIPTFKENVWTEKLGKDVSIEEVDSLFMEEFNHINPMKDVMMKVTHLEFSDSGCSLILEGKTDAHRQILDQYRQGLIEKLGLKFKRNGFLSFHITLSYLWKQLSKTQIQEQKIAEKKINEYINSHIEPFLLAGCELTFFNNMFDFKTDRSQLK